MKPNVYNMPPATTRNPLANKIISTVPRRQYRNSFQINQRISEESITIKRNPDYIARSVNKQHRKSKRSLDYFQKGQEKQVIHKEQRIRLLRREINKSQDQGTRISIHSLSKTKNTREQLSKAKHLKSVNSDESLFNPVLTASKSISKKLDISSLFYEDVSCRSQKKSSSAQIQPNSNTKMVSPKYEWDITTTIGKKIQSQFMKMVGDDYEINPLVALSVLEEIFKVDLNPYKRGINNLMAKQLMEYLADPSNSAVVLVDRLWMFITIIVGGNETKRFFKEEQKIKIYQQFSYFYQQRIDKQGQRDTPETLIFMPLALIKPTKKQVFLCQKPQKNMGLQESKQSSIVKFNFEQPQLKKKLKVILKASNKQKQQKTQYTERRLLEEINLSKCPDNEYQNGLQSKYTYQFHDEYQQLFKER